MPSYYIVAVYLRRFGNTLLGIVQKKIYSTLTRRGIVGPWKLIGGVQFLTEFLTMAVVPPK